MFTLIATLVSAASIVAAQVGTCARSYTVKEGDYCDAISAANNASTYQLAVSNYQTINDGCTNLVPDQLICLGITSQDCQKTYVVKEGDYCDLVSGWFGINSTLLMTNNPQIDDNCYNLYVGEVLCVADSVLVTPAPSGWTLPGSSFDDGSYDESDDSGDAPIVVITATTSSVAQATTITSAAAVTSSVAPAKSVNNAVVAKPSTDDEEECEDGEEEEDDNGDDDDVPDCE